MAGPRGVHAPRAIDRQSRRNSGGVRVSALTGLDAVCLYPCSDRCKETTWGPRT